MGPPLAVHDVDYAEGELAKYKDCQLKELLQYNCSFRDKGKKIVCTEFYRMFNECIRDDGSSVRIEVTHRYE